MFNNPNNSSFGNNPQNNSLLNNSLSGFGKSNTNLTNNSVLGGGFGQNQAGILSNTTNQTGFGGGLTNIGGGSSGGFNLGNSNANNQQQSSNILGTFGFSSKTQTAGTGTNLIGNVGSGASTGSFGFNTAVGSNTGPLRASSGFDATNSTNTSVGGRLGSNFVGQSANINSGSLTSGFGMNTAKNNLTSGFGLSNNATNSFSSGFGANPGFGGGVGSSISQSNNAGFGATNTQGFGAPSNTNSGFGVSSNTNAGFIGSNSSNVGSGSGGFGFGNTNTTNSAFGNPSGFSIGNNTATGLPNNTSGFSSGFGASVKTPGGFSSNIGGMGSFGMTSNSLNSNASNLSGGFGATNVNQQMNSQISNVSSQMKKPFYLGTSKTLTLNLGPKSNANNDYEFPQPPCDTISCLKFSPVEDFVAATAWDGTISIYGVDMDSQKVFPKSRKKIPGCALKSSWDSSGTKLYLACTDNTVKLWDLERDELLNVASHNQPVCSVNSVVNNQRDTFLLTGSWDKTLKYTDMRSKQAIKTFNLPFKVFDVDYMFPYAAAITSSRTVFTYKLTGAVFNEYRKIDSSLKVNNRCVTCFSEKHGKNCTGFLTGTISGRVTVTYFQQTTSYYHKSPQNDYCFRCNQPDSSDSSTINLYPVNSISFHPSYRTIVCGGSDGILYYNDIENKKKLGSLNQSSLPITATAVNRTGSALVYSVGYDWSRGYEYYDRANMKPEIYVRLTKEFVPKNGR